VIESSRSRYQNSVSGFFELQPRSSLHDLSRLGDSKGHHCLSPNRRVLTEISPNELERSDGLEKTIAIICINT